MGIYIAYGTLVPLTVILLYLIVKYSIAIRHEYLLQRNVEDRNLNITHRDFTKLDLEVVEADYRMPRGQWAHFIYTIPNLSEGQKTRKYVGNTVSGIKLPFMSLSMQNREFKDESDFAKRGPVKITMTNKILRVQSYKSDQSLLRDWKWADIIQAQFVTDDKTIQVTTNRNAWPLRFTFNNHEEAIEFVNAIWTLVDNYTQIDLANSGKHPDQLEGVVMVSKDSPKTTKKEKDELLAKDISKMDHAEIYEIKRKLTKAQISKEIDGLGYVVDSKLTKDDLANQLATIIEEENNSWVTKEVVTVDEETGVVIRDVVKVKEEEI